MGEWRSKDLMQCLPSRKKKKKSIISKEEHGKRKKAKPHNKHIARGSDQREKGKCLSIEGCIK